MEGLGLRPQPGTGKGARGQPGVAGRVPETSELCFCLRHGASTRVEGEKGRGAAERPHLGDAIASCSSLPQDLT